MPNMNGDCRGLKGTSWNPKSGKTRSVEERPSITQTEVMNENFISDTS